MSVSGGRFQSELSASGAKSRTAPEAAPARPVLVRAWQNLDLSRRFMVITSLALIIGMAFVGRWVSGRIADGVVHSHAVAAALYTDSFIEPLVQDLVASNVDTASSRQALDDLLLPKAVGQPIVGFRIWKGDQVVYSNDRSIVGRYFPPSALRAAAWSGKVVGEYEQHEPGHGPANANGKAILEIYAPVRRTGSSEIIALAETYQLAPDLPEELRRASIGSWVVLAAFTGGMLLVQFLIVNSGSRTIEQQRRAASERIAELSRLLAENEALRHRAQEANSRVAAMNERFLRGIGADLHDGPVQLVAMSVLRLGSLRQTVLAAEPAIVEEATPDLDAMRAALHDSLSEIRNISAGLALPEIEGLELSDVLRAAATRHERRTSTKVTLAIEALPGHVPLSIRSCAYRVVQEGLTNAFRHAGGNGQTVGANLTSAGIRISVSDAGSGVPDTALEPKRMGQGLTGLRDRVEALGGTLEFQTGPQGATLIALLPNLTGENDAEPHVD